MGNRAGVEKGQIWEQNGKLYKVTAVEGEYVLLEPPRRRIKQSTLRRNYTLRYQPRELTVTLQLHSDLLLEVERELRLKKMLQSVMGPVDAVDRLAFLAYEAIIQQVQSNG